MRPWGKSYNQESILHSFHKMTSFNRWDILPNLTGQVDIYEDSPSNNQVLYHVKLHRR